MATRSPFEEINEGIQQNLLSVLDRLPPAVLFLHGLSPKQREGLDTAREHFSDLKLVLKAYFMGKENPISPAQASRKRFMEDELRYYRAIYDLLWFGWSEIKAEVQNQPESWDWFPEDPGSALMFIFSHDCDAMTGPIINNQPINVRESKRILMEKKTSPQKGSVSYQQRAEHHKRLVRSKKYEQEVLERVSVSGLFLEFCSCAVRKRLRGKSQLRRELNQFKVLQKQHFERIRKLLEGRKGTKAA
jgi:hypothetical protein